MLQYFEGLIEMYMPELFGAQVDEGTMDQAIAAAHEFLARNDQNFFYNHATAVWGVYTGGQPLPQDFDAEAFLSLLTDLKPEDFITDITEEHPEHNSY